MYLNDNNGHLMVTFSITSAYKTDTESTSQTSVALALIEIEEKINSASFVIQLQTETGFYVSITFNDFALL